MSNENTYQLENYNGAALIRLSENVTGGSDALDFQNAVNEAAAGDYSKILIDLSQVQIMNSSGLGMLVAAHTSTKKFEKDIVFCNLSDKVNSLIEMTHLNKVLNISSDIDSAL